MPAIFARLTGALALLSLAACVAVEAPVSAPRYGKTVETVGKTDVQTSTEVSPDGTSTRTVTRSRSTSTEVGGSVRLPTTVRAGSTNPVLILHEAKVPHMPTPAGWNAIPEVR